MDSGPPLETSQLEQFFNLTRDLLCVAGFDGYFKTLNPAWEGALGFSRRELLAKPFIEFVHPDDRASTLAAAGRLSGGEEVVQFENRYRARDGSWRWFSWNARASPAGRFICATARDVTEQKARIQQIERLNRDLQEKEERFRMMLAAVKDYAIFMLDEQGNVVSWNAGAERIKGYRAEEIIGRHFSRFYPKQDIEGGKPARALERAAAQGSYEEQGLRVRKDGSQFWAHVLMTALRDEEGRLRGFVKITRDVTERRQAEEKIRRLHEQLQRRAAQLEESNRELEAFTYSVSHDLRAPLRHIDGFVDRLARTAGPAFDEKGRRYLRIISESARQMGNLIDDLLVFSRMGRAEMRQAKVDLEALVPDVIAGLREEIRDRQVTFKNSRLPQVQGDPSMLRQVFVNLLSNAVKYTRPRQQALIEIGASETPDEHVMFVRDNGVGFEMEYAHKLFGVFQRLHRPEDFEGTGIGLANVRRIIQRHGGRTWAEGKVNEGAVFYLSLPKKGKDTHGSSQTNPAG